MSLHNSCAGNKPVITGGWGSGQAGRGGQGREGRAGLPASSGFGVSPPVRSLYSLCKRELLHSWKLGSTSKGRPACRACAPRPASQNPDTPNQEHPLLGRDGETQGTAAGEAPLGNPLRHRPNRIIRHPPGPSPLCGRPPCLSLPTYHPVGTAGTPGSGRDTRPATQQPAGPRRASPLVSGRA